MLPRLSKRLHPKDRVLLVGDTRQHESVEAGRIFAQLQEAGMRTVTLKDIVRQKDPELKQTVEQLARDDVGEAMAGLEQQGRVHEIPGHHDRIAAMAKEYAKSPENTLAVSPDNRSRAEINRAIHTELPAQGIGAFVGVGGHPEPMRIGLGELRQRDRAWCSRLPSSWALPLSLASHRVSSATVMGWSSFSANAEVVSTINECEMRECLRKIPQLPVFFGIVFFRQKADIVAQRQQEFEK
jgi:hypothetical protein